MSTSRSILTILLGLLTTVTAAHAEDREHVDYIESLSGSPVQVREAIEPRQPGPADDADATAEHLAYVERDDALETWRLRPPWKAASPDAGPAPESPEHEDYIESLDPEDQRASHPLIWFDDAPVAPQEEPEDLPPPVTEIPRGHVIIEGDLVVPEDYENLRATYTTDGFWLAGLLPYVFDDNVSTANRNIMLNAMSDWEAVADIEFYPYNGVEFSYLYIQDATFNASEAIGMAGNRHDIWISNWNTYGTVMHELGHALAYYHEQSRFDRNDFVQINSSNISQSACDGSCDSQFALRSFFDDEYGPYDFDSVMHYGQCAFSACSDSPRYCTTSGCGCSNNLDVCRTITVPPPNEAWQSEIGQRDHLSYFDQKVMTMLYPQSNYIFLDKVNGGAFGGSSFFSPLAAWFLAEPAVPAGGTIWIIEPGVYTGATTITKRMFIRAPLGARLRVSS